MGKMVLIRMSGMRELHHRRNDMKTLEKMTKDERSLLLYLESRAVDQGGLVDTRHMNSDDIKIAQKWDEEGFIKYGRVCFKDAQRLSNPGLGGKKNTAWVELSDEAWLVAHAERKERALRMWEKRSWKKTEEL